MTCKCNRTIPSPSLGQRLFEVTHIYQNRSPTSSHGFHHQSLDSWSTNMKNKSSLFFSWKSTFHVIRFTSLRCNCRCLRGHKSVICCCLRKFTEKYYNKLIKIYSQVFLSTSWVHQLLLTCFITEQSTFKVSLLIKSSLYSPLITVNFH